MSRCRRFQRLNSIALRKNSVRPMEKQLTESIGAEMGIEGFAGADYEGSIDLDLIQRAMDGETPEAADEPTVETAVTEDTLRG